MDLKLDLSEGEVVALVSELEHRAARLEVQATTAKLPLPGLKRNLLNRAKLLRYVASAAYLSYEKGG